MGEAGEARPANGVSLSFHCGSIKPTLALWFWELTSCPLASHIFFFLVAGRDVFPGPQMLPVEPKPSNYGRVAGSSTEKLGDLRPGRGAWERGLDGGGGWEYLIATVLGSETSSRVRPVPTAEAAVWK